MARSSTSSRILSGLAMLAGAILWLLAARALWHSTVPSNLHLPALDPRRYFSAHFLAQSSSYERFLNINGLLDELALVLVLCVYAWRGQRLMRESAAGRIGTGIFLGMMGFALVWIAQIPFSLAAVWWERRHNVSHQGYINALIDGFLGLGSKFLLVSLALAIVMALAGVLRTRWWIAAVPMIAGLALLSSFLTVYLIPGTHALKDPAELADVRMLAHREGVRGVRVRVEDVARFTTAPNAEAVGFGSTKHVIVWDTLLDGRFSRREIRVVLAHELGHLAHKHPLKRVGWLALFLIPMTWLIARLTRSRGGMGSPEAVPLALLIFVLFQLALAPIQNILSRRDEAEADWSALRTTHDPVAAKRLFAKLAITSRADPDPPSWIYVLDEDHPTILQRIAMAEAYERRNAAGGSTR